MYRSSATTLASPGHLNADYNPRFRTIAATFQGWPGLYTVTDEAPTQVANTVPAPGRHPGQPDPVRPRRRLPAAVRGRPPVRPADVHDDHTADNTVITVNRHALRQLAPARSRLGGTTVRPRAGATARSPSVLPDSGSLRGPQAHRDHARRRRSDQRQLPDPAGARAGSRPPGTRPPTRGSRRSARASSSRRSRQPWRRPGRRHAAATGWSSSGPNAQTSANPRGRVHREPDRAPPGADPGRRAGRLRQLDGDYVPGSILDGLGFTPDNAQGDRLDRPAQRSHLLRRPAGAGRCGGHRASTTRTDRAARLRPGHRRVHRHRRRPARLPGQHQRHHGG